MRLFHIAEAHAWKVARRRGEYRPSSLDTDGFIHLSTEAQWLRVADTFYRGREDLVLLELDPTHLGEALRFDAVGDERFPHLYGPLGVESVTHVHPLVVGPDQTFAVPPGVEGAPGPPAP